MNSADSSVIHVQASTAVLAISKSILIVWAPGHCVQLGNKLADHQATLGAAESQPDSALELATQRALISHSYRLPSHSTRAGEGGVHVSLMSRSKRPLPRLSAPT